MNAPDRLVVAVEFDDGPVDAASAFFHRRAGALSTTVQYLPDYVADRRAYALDPGLPLMGGNRTVRGLPGCFADCAPDRWGRNLIAKRLAADAGPDLQVRRSLTDVDYLVGVADETRQGALRFRRPDSTRYLDPDTAVPPLVELPRLLRAADRVGFAPAQSAAGLAAIKDLLGAGTGTLGGARPKATVRDGAQLLIAKFPHRDDPVDMMAWESVTLDMAARAGIDVPGHRTIHVDGRTVLLLNRFDRPTPNQRIGYVSGMTMTEHRDGEVADYLDLAAAITAYGARPNDDLAALWQRIAFSVAVHNTDDHLRNHGFLRSTGGWTLSPVFDVNPEPELTKERVTGISGARTREVELEALATCAAEFGLSGARAAAELRQVFAATSDWRGIARRYGIAEPEIVVFESCFEGLRVQADRTVDALAGASPRRRIRSPRR